MRSGRLFIFLLLLTGLVGAVFGGAGVYSRLVYLCFLVFIGGWLWSRIVGARMHLVRTTRTQRVNVGDILEEHYELTNASRLPAPMLEIHNLSALPNASGFRLMAWLSPRQRRSYLSRSWVTRRGAFELGPTSITTGDPFGLFRFTRRIPPSQTLVALPLLFPIDQFPLPPGILPGGAAIRKRSPDVTLHASGVREYAPGDPLKRIHWLTSARRGLWMVKEFEQDPQAQFWLLLDLQSHAVRLPQSAPAETFDPNIFGRRPVFNLPPSSLEYAVSIAASLTHHFIALRRAVGFACAGLSTTVHHAERGARQEARILQTLAFVQEGGHLSLPALLAATHFPQGATLTLITPALSPQFIQTLDHLKRCGLHPLVIQLDSASFGGVSSDPQLASALHERRIPLCPIACGDDLSHALSTFAASFIPQEHFPWKNPAF